MTPTLLLTIIPTYQTSHKTEDESSRYHHKMVESDGWYLVTTRGDHRQYKHPTKPGRVTIAGTPKHDLAPGTLNSILKQAQLKEKK